MGRPSKTGRGHDGAAVHTPAENAARYAVVDRLRQIMADDFGVTGPDMPLHEPRHERVFSVACRSALTRRALAEAQADPARRQELVAYADALGLDLDSAEIIEVRLHSWARVPVDAATHDDRLDAWLLSQVDTRIPEGYEPIGRWVDAAPREALLAAQAAVAESRTTLQAAVRHALERGVSAAQAGRILSVDRNRIYQLRDGTR